MRKAIVFLVSLIICCTLVSTACCDAFYKNLKEELLWALANKGQSSLESYAVAELDTPITGAIVGFDMAANIIFIMGEISPGKYEVCKWDAIGRGFYNCPDIFNLIITQGIVDEISPETPILFAYKKDGDWVETYLEDAESAFKLCYELHGWTYP